mgnify:CR=1 FL=1
MIEDDRLDHAAVACEPPEGVGVQEEPVPSEARREARHRRRSAPEGPGQLPVGRAGDESRRDGPEQLRPLEVVRRRERLAREGAPAGHAAEARHVDAPSAIGPEALEPVAGFPPKVLRAVSPWTEARAEGFESLDGSNGKVHAAYRATVAPIDPTPAK